MTEAKFSDFQKAPNTCDWGLLPDQVIAHLEKKEWLNDVNLKARLLGSKPFPIRIGLKVPDGRKAVENFQHFQSFVKNWKDYPHQQFIQWQKKHYRNLGEQDIPQFFSLTSMEDLILAIGNDAKKRSEIWQINMAPLLGLSVDISAVLIKHLDTIEKMPSQDILLIKNIITQLYADMGAGQYLRALPIVGADTKFIENYQLLISDILDAAHGGAVTQKGGLLAWLACLENPKGWLYVRPLCAEAKYKMGGFPILQLPIDVLHSHELPATNILVVENVQSGLGLPRLKDTIVVFGGGKNVAWMDADWLRGKRVAYWGDIDTWGLAILGDVREKLPTVKALMMDVATIQAFEEQMVVEPKPVDTCPAALNDDEKEIFFGLKSGGFKSSRLEQERLAADYISLKVNEWLLK